MSNKQIIIILGSPGGSPGTNGALFAEALWGLVHHNDEPKDRFGPLIDTLTEELGLDPLRPARVEVELLTGPALRLQRLEARKIAFAASDGAFPLIHWHSAAALLIPFWRDAFEDTDIALRFVLLGSNALQVCDALTRDHSLTPASAMTVWSQTMLHTLQLAGPALIAPHYARLLANPQKVLHQTLRALAIDPGAKGDKRLEAAAKKIAAHDQSARAYTEKDVSRHDDFPGFIKQLNHAVETHFDARQLSDDAWTQIAPLLGNYEGFDFFLSGAQGVARKNADLSTSLNETTRLVARLEAANRALDSKLATLSERNTKFAQNRSELEGELLDLRGEIDNARHSNNQQIGQLSEKNQALARTLEDNEGAIANLQKLLEQQRAASLKEAHARALENVQLAENLKGAQTLADEIGKQRTHERQRHNLERASLLKEQRAIHAQIQATQEQGDAGFPDGLTDGLESDSANNINIDKAPDNQSESVRRAVEEAREQVRLEVSAEQQSLESRARLAEQQLLDQDTTLAHLTMEAQGAREEIRALKNSTSWKISAPVRSIKTALGNPKTVAKSGIKRTGRLVRQALSLGTRQKRSLPVAGNQAPANRLKDGDLGSEDHRATTADGQSIDPMAQGLEGCVPIHATTVPVKKKARAIAFYLPQYHTIPENDQWWGQGFTEWANVKPSQPQFPDHYQPHMPGDLGWYDLIDDPAILRRQAEMAKLHALSGFAFYFYWFGGKRLLEAPLQLYLNDRSIDFPFCLCWANENWSRRWDGRDHEILIAQDHSPEDDIRFISHLAQYLQDPRYIRIDGKPLLLVYRPGILPSARETSDRWRRWCRKNGIGEIYLAYTQSFEKIAPEIFGFDAAIEFPPNNHGLLGTPGLIGSNGHGFKGKVFDWRDLVRRSENYPDTPYKLFRGVNPSWDNTPRRGALGTVLLNSNPADYYRWLRNAVADTIKRHPNQQEQLVFINAWNEWAESAHLEPDQKYGYAWLEATRRALVVDPVLPAPLANPPAIEADIEIGKIRAEKKILIVTHDLLRHGAQYLSLNFARTLRDKFGYTVAIIACEDGPLRGAFEQVGTLTIIAQNQPRAQINKDLQALADQGFDRAIVNSSASGWLSSHLSQNGIKFIGLVHEMTSIITAMKLEDNLQGFNTHAEKVIFPAAIVRDQGARTLPEKHWQQAHILPQGVYKQDMMVSPDDKAIARKEIRKAHNIDDGAKIILGVGFGDHRKGIDLFLDWAIATTREFPDVHFIWVGDIAQDMRERIDSLIKGAGPLRERIHLPGFKSDTGPYYLGADIYALSSREDPFPSTALEALSAHTPVIMIAGTGGIEDLAQFDCVKSIDHEHAGTFVSAIRAWLETPQTLDQAGATGVDLVRAKFGFTSYVGDLLEHLKAPAPGVCVIVPSYNYERHLERRLTSIIEQSLPPREIVFLDDASSDNSVALARRMLARSGIRHRIIVNDQNSGNVFAQWQKGVELVNQPVTWIAEADDWADREFLAELAPRFHQPRLALAFAQSRQADENGKILAPDYRDYVRDIDPEKWTTAFQGAGRDEIAAGFAVKNTIPNVSGALFRTQNLQALLGTDIEFARRFRTAGDWYVYVNMLRDGDLYFSARPLNYHRRHQGSVTISKFDLADLSEIADMQQYVAREFSLKAEHRKAAKNYLRHLITQFSLHERYSEVELNAAISA